MCWPRFPTSASPGASALRYPPFWLSLVVPPYAGIEAIVPWRNGDVIMAIALPACWALPTRRQMPLPSTQFSDIWGPKELEATLGAWASSVTAALDQYMRDSGVEPVVLPPKSPNVNAHGERFVCSIKEEALGRMIFMGEASLRYAIRCYLNHYHVERNHQGLDNALITPEPEVGQSTGRVERRKHLGSLLSYDHREAA